MFSGSVSVLSLVSLFVHVFYSFPLFSFLCLGRSGSRKWPRTAKWRSWFLAHQFGGCSTEAPIPTDLRQINSDDAFDDESSEAPFYSQDSARKSIIETPDDKVNYIVIRSPLKRLRSVFYEKIVDAGLNHFKKKNKKHNSRGNITATPSMQRHPARSRSNIK